ncbi:MAG: FkbM family methyltransferase [Halioglobus sp.]
MKISIISPSFNQSKFLAKMLSSVKGQNYSNYEHLVFDPGSTDGSILELQEYAQNDSKADLYLEPDRGQANAINKGLGRSSGEILTWLNTDDYYFDHTALRSVAEFFAENPNVDIAYGRGLRVDSEGHTIKEAFIHPSGNDFLTTLQESIGILQPSTFFRRNVFETVGGLDEAWPLQLDYELWIRFAQAGFNFGRIDKVISKATVHVDAKSTRDRLLQLDECLSLMCAKFDQVSAAWIDRYTEFFLTGQDAKVISGVKIPTGTEHLQSKISTSLNTHYNQPAPSTAKREPLLKIDENEVTSYAKPDMGAPMKKRTIVTSFDSDYFNQGLNLIASLHRTSFDSFHELLVYSLDLSPIERTRLGDLEKVTVIDYPASICEDTFEGFLDPKSRAYKAYAMHFASDGCADGDLVLWLDAGLSMLGDIVEVFDKVDVDDFFITNHDESRHWPIYNASFIHPASIELVNPTNSELVAHHLCSAIVGYKKSGDYQHIIDQAWDLGQIPEVVLWPKVISKEEKFQTALTYSQKELKRDLLGGRKDPDALDRNSIMELFPHMGHRTQSVLSILATRNNAPVSSSKRYRCGNSQSSEASVSNWQISATNTAQNASNVSLEGIDSHVLIYHHRGVFNYLDGLRFRRGAEEFFIVGNGPSLRDFDFTHLERFDWLGMNAAYRYWQKTDLYPTYYACFDTVVQESHQKEICELVNNSQSNGILKFFLRKSILAFSPELEYDSTVFFLEDLQEQVELFKNDKITTGSYSALIGAYLGYREIYLLGIDLDYVEKLPEAKADGRALEINETPKENPNYFFDDYQIAGDRYNPPNRHPNMHLRSWRMISEILRRLPVDVVNLNRKSALKDFEFGSIEEILREKSAPYREATEIASKILAEEKEKDYWRSDVLARINSQSALIGPYSRDEKAHLDETKVIAKLIAEPNTPGFMIDVGAHHGSALAPFLNRSWGIQAFEPDKKNRAKLLERIRAHEHGSLVSLDERCVGKESTSGKPFYSSDQSTGISGLSSFHDSHIVSDTVDVVSLADFYDSKPLPEVDFLKIDTEGHDLFVLMGFPWDRTRPKVIECEFEDAKTLDLGYTFHDLADYLLAKGYLVYVSEWHSIVRYGIRHNWRQLLKYPCSLADSSGWGNLLAFREPVDDALLREAFAGFLPKIVENSGAEHIKKPHVAKVVVGGSSFSDANRKFRDGDFESALATYLELHAIEPLSIYKMNAVWAAKRLGLKNLEDIDKLNKEFETQ